MAGCDSKGGKCAINDFPKSFDCIKFYLIISPRLSLFYLFLPQNPLRFVRLKIPDQQFVNLLGFIASSCRVFCADDLNFVPFE
jgi:hypothetical protein